MAFSLHKLFGSALEVHRDLSVLGADMHAHFVPGIDDGAPDAATGADLVEALYRLGVHRFWLTPHIYREYYPNTPETIEPAFRALVSEVRRRNLPVRLYYAAEYFVDEYFEQLLEQKTLLCLPGARVLVELPFVSAPHGFDELLFRMQVKGYRPVLAHPERYGYWHGDLKRFARLKEKGCALQVNLLSLAGAYGRREQQMGEKLIRAGLVDFLGTDCHHMEHVKLLEDWLRKGRFRLPKGKSWENGQLK